MPPNSKPVVPPSGPLPLIPEKYIDVPSQRLYYLSLGLLCQAIKIIDFFWSITSSSDDISLCGKWIIVDVLYCVLLSQLRIPRLNYRKSSVVLQILFLCLLDGLMFRGISINIPALFGEASTRDYSSRADIASTPEPFSILSIISTISLGLLSFPSGNKDAHLLGQHTVRMSPISTAHLNPAGSTFCLASPDSPVLLPIILNNTNLHKLKYSITPLGYTEDELHGKIEKVELSLGQLKAIEQSYAGSLQLIKQSPGVLQQDKEEYDEYDDDDDDASSTEQRSRSSLQKTQTLIYIRVSKPGVIKLDGVVDAADVDARLTPSKVVVAPCPRVAFLDEDSVSDNVYCTGDTPDTKIMMDVYGVPPLSLKWTKAINGHRESFLVEGIEGGHNANVAFPQELKIPLSVSLDRPGTHLYVLEEITDGVGNLVRVAAAESDSSTRNSSIRKFTVLRKPTVSFEYCSTDSPAALLIGSETRLDINPIHGDELDAPWEVLLKYQPPKDVEDTSEHHRRLKAWSKVLRTEDNSNKLAISSSAPGDYSIASLKGKWCSGEVLAPETCRVVERPLPSAEITWKRIHECSGDTGVSATLILRGTPPFLVHYRSQRDSEPPKDLSKTFTGSRGELTLQPDRSGKYVFTFVHMSDANYRKVKLEGPSIDQVIHPLASAEFSGMPAGTRGKRKLNSCDGGAVDVDIDLKGTGPWNLELQIIGPRNSETLTIEGIDMPKKTISVPIPESVKKRGGNFEIDILTVEDAYKCKRAVAVPGIAVTVKTVKPTAQFYGSENERRKIVTEHESTSLPLRLTGDGPWRMKYRRLEPKSSEITIVLKDPNEQIHVTEKGLYKILQISDSQCLGAVIEDASTYKVDWIPRPSAKLSGDTKAAYDVYNGSYILSPVCEGKGDHVDLELTGRPPFQIQYNIARNSENGGTKLVDQPTFNSIQPHTRFQLQTSSPGRYYYEVKQIGDTSYPLSKHKNEAIPRSQRLLFEQQVLMRPHAQFKNRNRLTYCLNDMFTPLDATSVDGVVLLDGTPPFILELSIKNLAASQVETRVVEVFENVWRIDLPSYVFRSIGPHLINIKSVTDASNCAESARDPLLSSLWVDVAETAAIIPFERREDICVGDVSQFQLEGIPPWTIGYRINGKSQTQVAKSSPFSLLQHQPGEFTVTSISHQQKMCKAVVTDLKFVVHDLPSAQVGHGKKIYQDIHEGDQAEIVFTLVGEPPFTFTYQRSEPGPKKTGKPGKVLETHTVSRILTREYSIFSALEGTWTVTSISDRYCRYPPAKPDLLVEKHVP